MKNLGKGICEHWPYQGPFACDSEKIFILSSPRKLQEINSESVIERFLEIEIIDLVRMDFLQLESKLFFITRTSLISHSLENDSTMNEGEMSFDILDARWSPAQDLLVIVLANGAFFLQNSELEVLKAFQIPKFLGKNASITWRNDGKFFQICGNVEKGFLVFNFDCKGEVIENSLVSDEKGPVFSVGDKEDLLDSCLISWHFSQIAGVKENKIVFWERNGLKHEEFLLYGKKVLKIDWGLEGKVLSVLTDRGLELYCKFNFHWYFKHFLPQAKDFLWVDDFLVYLADGVFKQKMLLHYSENNGNVAVIDGVKVLLTQFSKGIIPPPLSHSEFQVDEPVLFVSLFEDHVLAVTSSKVIRLTDNKVLIPSKVDLLLQTSSDLFYSKGKFLFKLQDEQEFKLRDYPCQIISLTLCNSSLFIHTSDGSIYLDSKLVQKLSFPADSLKVFLNSSGSFEFLALKAGSLFLSNKLILAGCTSFYMTSNFLMMIKKSAPYDVLFVFSLNELPWNKAFPDPSNDHFFSRYVEKTSSIVALNGWNLILEHSRGNLETFAPRRLVLHEVENLVRAKDYLNSFKLLRQHKIDLNLLVDIEQELFDVKLFVQQVARQEYLNLFLTSLKDTNSTCKYYLKESEEIPGKTNKIADLIRNHLDPATHPLTILTSFIIKTPSEIETALTWIQSSSIPSSKPIKAPHESSHPHSTTEASLKYLSWLVNPDNLFNVALGMYDLQLTSTLAKFTQKDPKEYLPYLNSLNDLPETERKYQICMDLKNFPKALEELVKGGESYKRKALDLIKNQKLYIQGLFLLPGKETFKEIAESLANSEFAFQSAVLFELSDDFQKAQELYSRGEEWELACKMNDWNKAGMREGWSSKCAELGRFESAALIIDPLDQELAKVRYWLQGGKYKKAATVASNGESKDLVRSTLQHYAQDFCEVLDKNLKVFHEKKARLEFVQHNKKLMHSEDNVLNDEVASQFSVNSLSSKATQVSKKQRKNNRKIRKTAAKEGSVFEEDYLVDLLVSLRPDNSYHEKMEGLASGLIICGDFITARKVWSKFEEVKKSTFQEFATLRQKEFLKKFYEDFPEISKSEENDSRLKDMFAKSQFLADGLSSHKLPCFQNGIVSRFFMNFS
jgi:elongator complex protein 1